MFAAIATLIPRISTVQSVFIFIFIIMASGPKLDGENGLGCFFLLPKPLHSLHVPFCLHCFVECNNTVFNPWQCSLSAARCRKSNSNYKFNSSTIYRETTGIQWVSCMFVSAMTFILNIYQPSFPGCFSLSLFCAWWMQATTTTITTKSNWVHSGGWEQS